MVHGARTYLPAAVLGTLCVLAPAAAGGWSTATACTCCCSQRNPGVTPSITTSQWRIRLTPSRRALNRRSP